MEKVSIQEGLDKFRPEVCVFVLSVDENDKPNGMVAAWNMKCSVDPPLLAVCLSKKGNTQKLIRGSKEFVVAIANKEMEDVLLFFGSNHGTEVDKFAESGVQTQKADVIKTPLLKDATVNFECKLSEEVDVGDHIIFIGEVVSAHLNSQKKVLLSMGKVDGKRVFVDF